MVRASQRKKARKLSKLILDQSFQVKEFKGFKGFEDSG